MIYDRLPEPPDHSKKDLMILKALASVHYQFGRYRKAASILDLAMWIYPIDPGLLQMQAIVSLRRGHPERAARLVDEYEGLGLALSDEMQLVRRRAKDNSVEAEQPRMINPAN